MPQKVRSIVLPEKLTYAANTTVTKAIPQGILLRELSLRLSGTLTSAQNIAAASILAGAEWGLVKKLRIAAGTEVIKEFTGEELRINHSIFKGNFPRPRIGLGATTTNISSTIVIPFWDTLARRPMDTVLNTSGYGNLNLSVDFGDQTTFYTGTGGSFTGVIEGIMEASTGADPKMKIYETRMSRLEVTTISGASTDFAIPLLTGLVALRGLLIYAKDASNVDDPNLISTVKLQSLNTTLIEGDYATLRDQSFANLRLRDAYVSGAKASPMQDNGFNLDNYLFLDFAKDGYLSECLPTFNLGNLVLKLTTSAAVPKLVLVHYFVIPPSNPGAVASG
jgi:hypothetical protein